jgi:hypothetical protein
MVSEMAKSVVNVLVERLRAAKLSVPWVRSVAFLGEKFGSAPDRETEGGIVAVSRGRHRVYRFSWLWPCDGMGEIQRALEEPTAERCAAIVELFRAVALIKHLQAKRQIKQKLAAVYGDEFPFTLVALAGIAGRSRSLTPRPKSRQAHDISDVEARWAWLVWKMAERAHQLLLQAFQEKGVAHTCRHCDLLIVDMERQYCSERCRKAFHNARNYSRRKLPEKRLK